MTTGAIDLELQSRDVYGKKVKLLRKVGIIPVHLYGAGVESRSLQCQAPKLIHVLSAAGGSTPISITITGESGKQLAFAREVQWDPIRDDIIHVDLLVADTSRKVSAQVTIVLVGESEGARSVGGTVVHQLRTLDVEALPLEMPSQLEIDLSVLTEPDGVVRAGDIELPENVTRLTDAEFVIVRVELPRVEVEAGAMEGEEEVQESTGDAPQEGAPE